MADFVAKSRQFKAPQWADGAKRDRTIRRLISIIKTRAAIGIAAAVEKSGYDEVIPDTLKCQFGGSHYAFALQICLGFIDSWRAKHGYHEPMQYVFDQMSNGKRFINQSFEVALKGGADAVQRYGITEGGWSFQSKSSVLPLQAADIWAWENYRYMVASFLPATGKARMRRSYISLMESRPVVRYHNRESLIKFVNEFAAYKATGV